MKEELRPRPLGSLTQREIELCARVLSVLLPLSENERIDMLAIVCRALWDGRLDDPEFNRLAGTDGRG